MTVPLRSIMCIHILMSLHISTLSVNIYTWKSFWKAIQHNLQQNCIHFGDRLSHGLFCHNLKTMLFKRRQPRLSVTAGSSNQSRQDGCPLEATTRSVDGQVAAWCRLPENRPRLVSVFEVLVSILCSVFYLNEKNVCYLGR